MSKPRPIRAGFDRSATDSARECLPFVKFESAPVARSMR